MRTTSGSKVGFARIEEFKGLENEAVIVIDLPPFEKSIGNAAEHYVAMTRPRAILSIIQAEYPGETEICPSDGEPENNERVRNIEGVVDILKDHGPGGRLR